MTPALDIAVVIPTRDRPRLLEATIRSVLAQTRAPREIIVVDNGDGDETGVMMGRFGTAVTHIRQRPQGVQAARNAGVRAAAAGWIALLDDDDLYQPEFLACCEPSIRDGRATVIGANHRKFRGEAPDRLTNFEQAPPGYWRGLAPATPEPWTFVDRFPVERLTWFVPFYPSATMIRRDLFERVGGYDVGLRGVVAEDIEMLVRVLRAGRLAVLWEARLRYRIHPGNDSGYDHRGYARQTLGRWQVFAYAHRKLRNSDPELARRIEEHLPRLRARAFDAGFGLHRFDLAGEIAAGLRPEDWTAKRRVKRWLVGLPRPLMPLVSLVERAIRW